MPSRTYHIATAPLAVDRTRDGHRTFDSVTLTVANAKHSGLLNHDISRQQQRNRERKRNLRERERKQEKRAIADISRKSRMHSVLFNFVFGSDRHGNQITSESEGVGPMSGSAAPHENITLAYTVAFPKPEPFRLSMLQDSVHEHHRETRKRVERMTNTNKSAALEFVTGIVTESVQSWLEDVDEDTIRFNVDDVLSQRQPRVLDLRLAGDVVGHVRLQVA